MTDFPGPAAPQSPPMALLRGDDPQAIALAADRLASGGLVAFPTETVYGLGARADDDAAVARIFAAKGRPADHPLIVHVADGADAAVFAEEPPAAAQRLIEAFWPGPVTLILRRRTGVATAAAGGQDSIGLRCPSHPVAHALLRAARALGVPGVAAPSANRFGRVSPTRAVHVAEEFDASLLVLDGGDCAMGIESTIVDLSRGRPVLLRPGPWPRSTLESVLGEPLQRSDAQSPRASGTLASHYAPRARVRLLPPQALQGWLEPAALPPGQAADGSDPLSRRRPEALAVYSRQPPVGHPTGVHWRAMPGDAASVAHELFAVLRALDRLGVDEIWVEMPPEDSSWEGVRDRLVRAAA